eukprot:scaffold16903_cov133-Isochrysis_galbana.AAC.4
MDGGGIARADEESSLFTGLGVRLGWLVLVPRVRACACVCVQRCAWVAPGACAGSQSIQERGGTKIDDLTNNE